MMRRTAITFSIAVLTLGCSGEPARGPVDQARTAPSPPPYLAGTTSRVIRSSRADREYQVSVALPRGYEASAASYPVLYALDANGEFGTVVETARLLQLEDLIPELVVVGIGYPVGHYFDAVGKRALDLTVSEDSQFYLPETSRAFPPLEGTGGAARFLQFLTEELIPLTEKEYRIDRTNRALLGHSFGGLFAFYALVHGQGTFHRFVVSSPALWWDDRVSFRQESAFAAANDRLVARAFFSVGLLEPEPTEQMPYAGYIANLRELERILERRKYRGFEMTVHFFEDEFHTSVFAPAVSRGLRYIYKTK